MIFFVYKNRKREEKRMIDSHTLQKNNTEKNFNEMNVWQCFSLFPCVYCDPENCVNINNEFEWMSGGKCECVLPWLFYVYIWSIVKYVNKQINQQAENRIMQIQAKIRLFISSHVSNGHFSLYFHNGILLWSSPLWT